MTAANLSLDELQQCARRGIALEEVQRQIRLFEQPPAFAQIVRPCTVGDGIQQLGDKDIAHQREGYERARDAGRLTKFVPASGAASRMFQALFEARALSADITVQELRTRAAEGHKGAAVAVRLFDDRRRFAFYESWAAAALAAGIDLEALMSRGAAAPMLNLLLTRRGLDYAELPKGLLEFHRYAKEARTPFEEHLVEAAAYARDADGRCRLHLTVSPEHEARFRARLEEVRRTFEGRYDAHFDIAFSMQKASTNTIAVDPENRPFRAKGELLFRPGGHGSLIENLNELGGDIVVIKNIDNVVPDRLRAPTIRWKQALVGHLVALQDEIFANLRALNASASTTTIAAAAAFSRRSLGLDLGADFDRRSTDEQCQSLCRALDRPLRVCGAVRNTGEPGGGPFWVRNRVGAVSAQIVESAELDPADTDVQAMFRTATHFNPVDLVCGLRDFRGAPFDLRGFVDQEAVFIAQKSHDGRALKALERPGLWNGAMAHWITVFVEVPVETFTPVKTVLDLLRPEHQAEG